MIKLALPRMRSAIGLSFGFGLCFFFFHINSFELQKNSLGTFNEFVELISPTNGLQEKHLIEK